MKTLNMVKNLRKLIPVFIFILAPGIILNSQNIDILIKGGHVIDPKNKIDAVMDVAVAEGKILKVAPSISAENAKKIIDAKGLYVTPGLIDIHTHVFVGSNQGFADGFSCVSPDDITLKAGIT
ncbi:MAG: amidohydrolase family protein, partial [Bacteroidales bacterium]|nr:amidohydrolase family protein [Bacteroidales bacterium]